MPASAAIIPAPVSTSAENEHDFRAHTGHGLLFILQPRKKPAARTTKRDAIAERRVKKLRLPLRFFMHRERVGSKRTRARNFPPIRRAEHEHLMRIGLVELPEIFRATLDLDAAARFQFHERGERLQCNPQRGVELRHERAFHLPVESNSGNPEQKHATDQQMPHESRTEGIHALVSFVST
jgi:hypothetical protein